MSYQLSCWLERSMWGCIRVLHWAYTWLGLNHVYHFLLWWASWMVFILGLHWFWHAFYLIVGGCSCHSKFSAPASFASSHFCYLLRTRDSSIFWMSSSGWDIGRTCQFPVWLTLLRSVVPCHCPYCLLLCKVIDGGIDQGIGNFIDQVRNPTPAGMSWLLTSDLVCVITMRIH